MLHYAHVNVLTVALPSSVGCVWFDFVVLHFSTAPCEPCTDAEVLLAVCTSDFGKTKVTSLNVFDNH